MEKICQSCGMPLDKEELFGKNKDGSQNEDYCKYCYQDGEFVDDVTMEEYITMCAAFEEIGDLKGEAAKDYYRKLLPTLKRWKSE